MKTIIHIALFAWTILLSTLTLAQPLTGPSADIGAGKKRAAACFACHSADGISKIPGTPHLAGQERSYLEQALRAYRDGQTRQNPTMNAMAKPLSDRDIANIAAYFSLQTRMSNGQTAAQALETMQRIRPVADLTIESTVNAGSRSDSANRQTVAARTGDAVYSSACLACHGTGAAGAPKLGDKPAWSGRLAQGKSTLLQHALEGYKGMPAKGACTTCTDEEIKAAVEFLVDKAR